MRRKADPQAQARHCETAQNIEGDMIAQLLRQPAADRGPPTPRGEGRAADEERGQDELQEQDRHGERLAFRGRSSPLRWNAPGTPVTKQMAL